MTHAAVVDASPGTFAGSTSSAPPRGVVAVAGLAAVAPFDLALPADGWTVLHLRPLMLLVLAVSAWVIVADRGSVSRRVGMLEVGVAGWLVAVWVSTALSVAPAVGAAGAIRMTGFGLLVVATKRTVRCVDDARIVLRWLVTGAGVAASVGIVVWLAGREVLGTEHLVGQIGSREGLPRLTRPWSNPNIAAMAIGASLPALMVLARRPAVVVASIGIPALVLTDSRGGLIALAAAGLAALGLRPTRSTLRSAAVVAVGTAIVFVTAPIVTGELGRYTRQESRSATMVAPSEIVLGPAGTTVPIEVANTGPSPWPASGEHAIELAARWVGAGQDWSWGEHRWPLPVDLAPGESLEVDLFLDGSIPDGGYVVHWDLVGRGETRFLRPVGRSVTSAGLVADSTVDPAEVEPAHFRPRRGKVLRPEIWRLAIGEFEQRPLLGVGPSELGVATADDLGDVRAFGGRHAHNLLLEPLATTGLAGTAALFVVLGGAWWRALRWARRTRHTVAYATAIGLTAVGAHGLVDWPLVYTSSAIPVAVLVGIAWCVPAEVSGRRHRPRGVDERTGPIALEHLDDVGHRGGLGIQPPL